MVLVIEMAYHVFPVPFHISLEIQIPEAEAEVFVKQVFQVGTKIKEAAVPFIN